MNIVERIWLLIEQRNISAYKLAKDVGLSTSHFSQWKSGKVKPSLEAVMIMADYFSVSVDYLLGRTERPEVNK